MSVDAIKKFLEDNTHYPDNTLITIGDAQVPLGSLRALNTAERGQLADAIKSNEDKSKDLDSKRAAVLDLAQKAQNAHDAAQEALKKATVNRTPGDDPFTDPWLAPVKSALDERDKTIVELRNMMGTMASTVANAAKIFSEERWDSQYNSLNFGKREKKPTRDEVLKFATDNKLVDRHGLPSITAAWDKMSEADRMSAMREEEREKGREEGRMAALASRVPMPGVPGVGQSGQQPRRIGPETDVLGDLAGESIKDPELRALMEQVSGMGVV